MKGAMSDPDQAFMQKINDNLFKKSQYKFNSGGEPSDITNLEYDELKAFHTKYYHPSNGYIYSYGDLDFTTHLDFVQNQCLKGIERHDNVDSELLVEPRVNQPIIKEENFMPDLMQD